MTGFQNVMLCGIVLLAGYALWPAGDQVEKLPEYFDIKTSKDHRVSFMGLTVGASSLLDAEKRFSRKSARAMFINKTPEISEKMQIEAYFEELYGSDKLILTLFADDKLKSIIREDSYRPYVYPDGTIKLQITQKYSPLIDELAIESITYLPYQRLDKKIFDGRFGVHEYKFQAGQEMHFLYPGLGLDITRMSSQDILLFVQPENFSKLLEPLQDLQLSKVR